MMYTMSVLQPTNTSGVDPSLKPICDMVDAAIAQGVNLWKANKRAECYQIYRTVAEKALKQLPPGQVKERLRESLDLSARQTAAAGAMTLRKGLDAVLTAGGDQSKAPAAVGEGDGGAIDADGASRISELQQKLDELKRQADAVPPTTTVPPSLSMSSDMAQTLR